MNTQARRYLPLLIAATLAASSSSAAADNTDYSFWGEAVPETDINDAAAGDGCPIESSNGKQLYIASNRSGTYGGNDIWIAHRQNPNKPWSAPENAGEPVNSEFADYCPTPIHNGHWLLFVSERPGVDTCGAGPGSGDIYMVRKNPPSHWLGPWGPIHNLGCAATGDGPNFDTGEYSPYLLDTPSATHLYFSSFGPFVDADGDGKTDGDMDIYVSELLPSGRFSMPLPVEELNTEFDDRMPNLRKDGLEIVFSSNRPGGFGSQDVYSSTRSSVDQAWSDPVLLGDHVNTDKSETRATISGDAKRLHFGRSGEIFVSTRHSMVCED